MRFLEIDNNIIDTPLEDILYIIQKENKLGKLRDIKKHGENILVTCPEHKKGKENHPSCSIYIGDNPKKDFGHYHCFSCGSGGSFIQFVALCFGYSEDRAKTWLLNRFGKLLDSKPVFNLEPIDLTQEESKEFDLSVLNAFEDYHPYMLKRKLSLDVCREFNVKYDPKTNSLVFLVCEPNDKPVFLTRRNVDKKQFIIASGVEKPVYLLNEINKRNIKEVLVCESQINALYAWSLGYPAIALFGTGTSYQYQQLNNSAIRHYILCLDGDAAGEKGIERFKKNIRKDVFVDSIQMAPGKDLNDLSQEEADTVLKRHMKSIKLFTK